MPIIRGVFILVSFPPMIPNQKAVSIRGAAPLNGSPDHIFNFHSGKVSKPFPISSKLTFQQLFDLASPDVKIVQSFSVDVLTSESLPLIAQILPKTEDLSINTDSPLLLQLLSQFPSLPAKNLTLSVKINKLP
jgi:hypothetical protein